MRRLVALRDSGASWPMIAKTLGIGTGTAFRAHQRLSKTPDAINRSKTPISDELAGD
jgi:hypothetical protein